MPRSLNRVNGGNLCEEMQGRQMSREPGNYGTGGGRFFAGTGNSPMHRERYLSPLRENVETHLREESGKSLQKGRGLIPLPHGKMARSGYLFQEARKHRARGSFLASALRSEVSSITFQTKRNRCSKETMFRVFQKLLESKFLERR